MEEQQDKSTKVIRHQCPLSERDVQSVHEMKLVHSQILSELQKIKASLIGDEYNDGLKQRVDRHEKELEFHRKMQWGIVGVGAFIGLVTGFKAIIEWIPSLPKEVVLFYITWL